MKKLFFFFILFWVINSCTITKNNQSPYRLVFGSCTDAYKDSIQMWHEMKSINPDLVFILGDIVYTHTENPDSLQEAYNKQKAHPDFKDLIQSVNVEAIYDDNDFGLSDGGKNNPFIQQSKSMVLDFLGIPKDDERYNHEGLYFSRKLTKDAILITMDTRSFRDDLTKSKNPGKRYDPNPFGQGSILGENQWDWLEKTISETKCTTIILASTIQIINNFHGYEHWGNMEHERKRLFNLLQSHPEKRFILLSGDRHFSEVSQIDLQGLNYLLYEITSSGITQIYSSITPEPNPLRISPFIREYNYTSLDILNDEIIVTFFGRKNIILHKQTLKIQH